MNTPQQPHINHMKHIQPKCARHPQQFLAHSINSKPARATVLQKTCEIRLPSQQDNSKTVQGVCLSPKCLLIPAKS